MAASAPRNWAGAPRSAITLSSTYALKDLSKEEVCSARSNRSKAAYPSVPEKYSIETGTYYK